MIDGKNFNTRENWNKRHTELQDDLRWLDRRKDWAPIARTSPAIEEIAKAILKYRPEAKTFLEIGPGDGYMIFGLSRRLKIDSLSAMDISDVSLFMTSTATPQVKTFLSSMETMSLGEKFDVILAAQTLEHSSDISKSVSNIKEHLSPNGILIAVVPYLWEIDEQHNYVFDDQMIYELCKKIGRMELVDSSVQYRSKIVVARNV